MRAPCGHHRCKNQLRCFYKISKNKLIPCTIDEYNRKISEDFMRTYNQPDNINTQIWNQWLQYYSINNNKSPSGLMLIEKNLYEIKFYANILTPNIIPIYIYSEYVVENWIPISKFKSFLKIHTFLYQNYHNNINPFNKLKKFNNDRIIDKILKNKQLYSISYNDFKDKITFPINKYDEILL